MFTKILDVVLGRTEKVEEPEGYDISLFIIWLFWFSIMLFLAIGVI